MCLLRQGPTGTYVQTPTLQLLTYTYTTTKMSLENKVWTHNTGNQSYTAELASYTAELADRSSVPWVGSVGRFLPLGVGRFPLVWDI